MTEPTYLELARTAEAGELRHSWQTSRITADVTCTVCHTVGIGDDEDMCDGPKVWGLWHGGPSYSFGYIEDDLEEFTGLAHAKEAMIDRIQGTRVMATFYYVTKDHDHAFTPAVEESTMTVWFYDPRDEHDPYPDLLLQQTDDGITEELT